MIPHLTTWELDQKSGEPHTIIRVKNLQTSLAVGKDAWGRRIVTISPPIQQPILISCTVSLREPFSSASETDTVTGSTVHYGILSKAILKGCQAWGTAWAGWNEEEDNGEGCLAAFVMYLERWLTGGLVEGVLKPELVKKLEIEVRVPKASLMGAGVGMKCSFTYDDAAGTKVPSSWSSALTLHELRIPALIGVNAVERLAKQMVIATIVVDRYLGRCDNYGELEQLVVKTIEESSFETLEALASIIGLRYIRYIILPNPSQLIDSVTSTESSSDLQPHYPRLRISLEKPTAVPFADGPCVEMLVDTDPTKNKVAEKNLSLSFGMKQVPFPLQGTLQEWIDRNDPTGLVSPI